MNRVSIFLARMGLDQPLHSLAGEISKACESDVWGRLSATPSARSINEARGFVRARTTLVAGRNVSQNQPAMTLPGSMRQRLTEMVTQRLVDGLAPRLYENSSPHELRRAA